MWVIYVPSELLQEDVDVEASLSVQQGNLKDERCGVLSIEIAKFCGAEMVF